MESCAPSASTIERSYTCFSLSELQTIAATINQFIEKKQPVCINDDSNKCIYLLKKDYIQISNDKKELWQYIFNTLEKLCPFEKCWINTNVLNEIKDKNLRHQLKYFTIKPKMREPNLYWLSTSDINYVMNQYSKIYPSFLFLGAHPCDFYKINNIDYDEIKKYNKIGIICNLDPHDKPGYHWVAIFIDNVSKSIEYYDSTGNLPIKELTEFINKLKNIFAKHKYIVNNIKHQNKDTECGVYSIYFIVQRLLGYSFDTIVNNIISDDFMVKYRNLLFTD